MAYPLQYQVVTDQAGGVRKTSYREANVNSPNYIWEHDRSSSERTYYIPWTNDPAKLSIARSDFLGYPEVANMNGQKFIARLIPHHHPNFPNELYADSCHIGEGISAAGQDANSVGCYDEAKIRVTYTRPNYVILTDDELKAASGAAFPDEGSLLRYVSISRQSTARQQTIPQTGALRWDGPVVAGGPTPGQAVSSTHAFLLHEGDLTIVWHQIPIESYPYTAVLNCINKTNDAPFGTASTLLGQPYPTGTLVCGIPKLDVIPLPNGRFGMNVTYNFKFFPNGANKFYFMAPGKEGGFYPAAFDGSNAGGGTKLLHKTADFKTLFRPEP